MLPKARWANTGRICRSYYKKMQFLILFNQKSPLKFIENASNNNKFTINHIHLCHSLVTLKWQTGRKTDNESSVFLRLRMKTNLSLCVFWLALLSHQKFHNISVTRDWLRCIWFMVYLLLLEAFSMNLRGDFWLNKMRNCIFYNNSDRFCMCGQGAFRMKNWRLCQ